MPKSDATANRSNRAKSKSEGALSRESIVAAAIAEIDQHGLNAFSIRNLSTRLGVYPTAIYWHIPNRDMILAEVVGQVLGSAAPNADLSWRDFLRQLFVRYRDAIQQHPNVAPLVGAHLIGNSAIPLELVEILLTKLAGAGFQKEGLVGAYNSVIAALAGFITQEFAPVPTGDDGAWKERVQERLRSVDAETFPTLAANLDLLANRAFILRWQGGTEAPLDASFHSYVEMAISGLAHLAARGSVS